LSTGKYYPQVPTVAEHMRSLEMLVAKDQGMNWETGREYLKGSVLSEVKIIKDTVEVTRLCYTAIIASNDCFMQQKKGLLDRSSVFY
jgi:hypothetical protein